MIIRSQSGIKKVRGRIIVKKEWSDDMKNLARHIFTIVAIIFITMTMPLITLADKKAPKKKEEQLALPNNVLSITKSNTFPNPSEEMAVVEPSELTKQLLESINEPIENPEIIKLLNETTVKTTPFTLGYQANIYLGRWPLYYKSESSSIIWDYEHVNTNELNNRGGNESAEIKYIQQKDRTVKGALMNKIDEPDMIKKLILQKVKSKATFSVAFSTKVGANTKLNNVYNIGAKKIGVLDAYVPAVNEKGQVVYGDLYVTSKGSDISLNIKNVTKHGIGAWIPIQDHISLMYSVK